jgi:hypothetical protein
MEIPPADSRHVLETRNSLCAQSTRAEDCEKVLGRRSGPLASANGSLAICMARRYLPVANPDLLYWQTAYGFLDQDSLTAACSE